MSDIILNLNNISRAISIQYSKNYHGFSNPDNDTKKYLFELIINGQIIGKKYFRNLEEIRYSHLIKLEHKIKFSSIQNYKTSISIYPNEYPQIFELEGIINQNETTSTHKTENIYIEFTQNNNGYALCSCFYVGLDNNKIFASPPN